MPLNSVFSTGHIPQCLIVNIKADTHFILGIRRYKMGISTKTFNYLLRFLIDIQDTHKNLDYE